MERLPHTIPAATVERLSVYHRWLTRLQSEGRGRVYSHDLAALGKVTPAQVRRDLGTIGYAGSPVHGYEVAGLLAKIGELLNPS